MSIAVDLYRALTDYLRMSSRVVARGGSSEISVGEKFTLRFTVTNVAPDPSATENPMVLFRDVKLMIDGTEFARPVSGRVSMSLPDTRLLPGESSSVDVEMVALRDIEGISDLWSRERVARARVEGRVDQDAFFRLRKLADIREEIK